MKRRSLNRVVDPSAGLVPSGARALSPADKQALMEAAHRCKGDLRRAAAEVGLTLSQVVEASERDGDLCARLQRLRYEYAANAQSKLLARIDDLVGDESLSVAELRDLSVMLEKQARFIAETERESQRRHEAPPADEEVDYTISGIDDLE